MKLLSQLLCYFNDNKFLGALLITCVIGLLLPRKLRFLILSLIALAAIYIAGLTYLAEIDAWFLNYFGVEGRAMITRTNNNHYAALIKTADGKEIPVKFSENTAVYYPVKYSNHGRLVSIPESGQSFPIKFIPGAEQNFVILETPSAANDQSNQQVRNLDKLKKQYETSPQNLTSRVQYLNALQDWIKMLPDHLLTKKFQEELNKLQNGE